LLRAAADFAETVRAFVKKWFWLQPFGRSNFHSQPSGS
jgi:hypothetical protein